MMRMLRACADWRVVALLAAVGIGVALFAPNLIAAAIPLLIVAVCPLSMVLMMGMMGRQPSSESSAAGHGSPDQREQLRARLAGTRREQEQLERELARLDAADPVGEAQPHGSSRATDIQARST